MDLMREAARRALHHMDELPEDEAAGLWMEIVHDGDTGRDEDWREAYGAARAAPYARPLPTKSHPCGHVARQQGCGGCDPGAIEWVRDDGGQWRHPTVNDTEVHSGTCTECGKGLTPGSAGDRRCGPCGTVAAYGSLMDIFRKANGGDATDED